MPPVQLEPVDLSRKQDRTSLRSNNVTENAIAVKLKSTDSNKIKSTCKVD